MKAKETHEEKRRRLEAKLNEIGLTNYVVFEEFKGEILPGVYGDSTEILSTVLKALDADPIFQKTFFAMIDGYQQGKMDQVKEFGEPVS